MSTCPWCGTASPVFQPNCPKCGGPWPAPQNLPPTQFFLPEPPPAPRPIATRYALQLGFSDGWFIVGLVFSLLGIIFGGLGFSLTLGLVTAFVGLPFLGLGLVFLSLGLPTLAWRSQAALKIVRVLQVGQAARGEILSVEQNFLVRVNHRHPWKIVYRFEVLGQAYQGQVSTLNTPGPQLQAGQAVYSLYLPENPNLNVIYPHP